MVYDKLECMVFTHLEQRCRKLENERADISGETKYWKYWKNNQSRGGKLVHKKHIILL